MMMSVLYVAIGGAVGSVLRYLVGLTVVFPFGTLAVNVAGSLLIGAVWARVAGKAPDAWFLPLVMFGVLGGFTTFSSFSLDTMKLLQDGRIGFAAGYVAASVLLSLAACALGLWMFREGAV